MPQKIETITTPFILNISVNCYLVRVDDGFILVDTARAGQRKAIEQALESAGCRSGDLKLIVLTHGDFDHCGNAAYLRQKYETQVAMHQDDTGMVEHGNMFWNRKPPNIIIKAISRLLFRLAESDRFKPDLYLKEGDTLTEYGLNAQVIEIPGHSRGSIGLLMDNGDLICGDLMGNTGKHPEIWSIMDDLVAAQSSIAKLRTMNINRVYPGHGQSFPMSAFNESNP